MAIVVIGMLDEREEGLRLLREYIERRGHKTILIDVSIGTGGIIPSLRAEISCEEIAHAGGTTVEKIKEVLTKEREKATSMMAEGLKKKVLELYESGELQGVIAVGGMTGTSLSLTAMRALPFGVPKVLISSVAAMPAYAKRLAEYFGVRDITVMHSVVDTVGLNPLVRSLMVNGANAICGMVEGFEPPEKEGRPTIALTELGFCDKGAHYVRELLEKNYNIVSFHATGLGDRAAEDLVNQGLFGAFIDLVPAGFSEYLLGGNRAAGPDRLEAACNQGIPYILAPCGFDMISCGPIERRDKADPLWVSRRLAERKLLVQDAMRVQARTSAEEMQIITRAVAEKLNKHKDKKLVKFLIPTKGFSSLSVEGGALYDPNLDQTFMDELKKNLDPEIEIIEVDAHINTPKFARTVVEALEQTLKKDTP
ncbi:MAG: Tm-1-like ATP-binding domain-containing protein [Deltaproteobacteria bacterium]|nr:Tm-1-like ATP-binding domain-containing protein [Deltaproteobacteria bacterium]